MSRRYFVYKHMTPSGKSYIGITTNSLRERIRSGYRHNIYLENAIKKYGWENIRTEILADSVTSEEASLLESYYIEALETKDHSKGYNIEDGGVQKNSFSEETRQKISEAAKKRHVPISEETKDKLREKAKRKPVINIDTGEKYESIKAAAAAVNGNYRHVSDVCNGRRKTACGYRWRFVDG